MLCPSDNTPLHQVRVQSHYDQPIILEQCKTCGGVWFDDLELFRAKHGEAEKIELVDVDMLRTFSPIKNAILVCPKDKSGFIQFRDKYFLKDIVIERCPTCNGFWLQRGEFSKYQKVRKSLQRPEEKINKDKKFEEDIDQMLSFHKSGSTSDVLGRLGSFLSTPLDRNTLRPLESANISSKQERAVNMTLDVLDIILTILNLFIHR